MLTDFQARGCSNAAPTAQFYERLHLSIEVLPKADRTTHRDHAPVWRGVLLYMLHECRWLRVDAGDLASLGEKKLNLLEAYLLLFLRACERLLHEGLVKKYRREEANATALKGMLLFAQNLRKNLVHAERFYVDHTVYDRNNPFNAILATALRCIPNLTADSSLTGRAARLLLDWPALPDVAATEALFARLRYDRKTERYRDAVAIARMILLHYRPDISGGAHSVLAVLFDMPSLWEAFILHRLHAATQDAPWHEWSVQGQEAKSFWQNEKTQRTATIRPDIVLRHPQHGTIVLDTKWKVPEDAAGPSDADLKQMYAYNRYWNRAHSALMYPSRRSVVQGRYSREPPSGEGASACSMMGVEVVRDGGLSQTIGEELLAQVRSIKAG